jgi:hypothetical protein
MSFYIHNSVLKCRNFMYRLIVIFYVKQCLSIRPVCRQSEHQHNTHFRINFNHQNCLHMSTTVIGVLRGRIVSEPLVLMSGALMLVARS